jgi:hypothetical protein
LRKKLRIEVISMVKFGNKEISLLGLAITAGGLYMTGIFAPYNVYIGWLVALLGVGFSLMSLSK